MYFSICFLYIYILFSVLMFVVFEMSNCIDLKFLFMVVMCSGVWLFCKKI